MRKIVGGVVGGIVISSLLVGCSGGQGASTSTKADDSKLGVIATTTQICDYVKQIDADVDLTCLLAPNASAHDHEMTREQMDALSKADILLKNGVDLEHFLDDAVASSGFKGTTVDTSEGVNIAPWPFAPEDGEEPEFNNDPHIWTSPKNAKIQVANIGKALEAADSAHADDYKKHVNSYISQLEDLDTWTAQSLKSVPESERILFTSHDAFGYFSRDYNVKFIGAALSDFNEQQDATADHIAKAAQQVRDSKAKALFAENSNNPRSIEAVAKAAGVKLGGELYGDSLGPDVTYTQSIVHNVETLIDGWGGKIAEKPASIAR
ncbi:zinc ABC transporter substrate-binding protein [Corynebacterium diphtheriae]|nr:zinc ABC transporter substrate-binding protein [Corynebacterium diphtheriae]CAB0791099.1 zinc ABC transporter substrate-binding protein [Corynebacterium diphtheriae]